MSAPRLSTSLKEPIDRGSAAEHLMSSGPESLDCRARFSMEPLGSTAPWASNRT